MMGQAAVIPEVAPTGELEAGLTLVTFLLVMVLVPWLMARGAKEPTRNAAGHGTGSPTRSLRNGGVGDERCSMRHDRHRRMPGPRLALSTPPAEVCLSLWFATLLLPRLRRRSVICRKDRLP